MELISSMNVILSLMQVQKNFILFINFLMRYIMKMDVLNFSNEIYKEKES